MHIYMSSSVGMAVALAADYVRSLQTTAWASDTSECFYYLARECGIGQPLVRLTGVHLLRKLFNDI
jgi:hypothetical protein